jgi:hypothetical protein
MVSHNTGRGLVREALLAALPPVAVYLFETFLRSATNRWYLVVALVVLYVVAFFLIYLIGLAYTALDTRFPPRLPQLGQIEGWWIDIVRGLDEVVLAGAVMYLSYEHGQFVVKGAVYMLEQDRTQLIKVGWFSGKGSFVNELTMGYGFDGELHSRPDSGGGHFSFAPSTHPSDDSCHFRGSFIGAQRMGNREPAYHFYGRRPLKDSEESAEHMLLKELQCQSTASAAIASPATGRRDGSSKTLRGSARPESPNVLVRRKSSDNI